MSQIDWSSRVANPEALGEAEKEIWTKVSMVLEEVLDELKKNGKIETVFLPAEASVLLACLQKLDDFSLLHNMYLHLSDSEQKAEKFLEATREFGFDETKTVATYILILFTLAVLQTELFKVLLLYHLKDVPHEPSRFVSVMTSFAPKSWPKLQPFVDSAMRNALAHGTYTILNEKIILYRDAKLEPIEQMGIGDCMMRNKAQGVLFQCLINKLRDKGESGFFSP